MNLYAIRITANNDDQLKQFSEQYKGLWCKEGGDLEKHCAKPHYHGIVETTKTTNGLRKQIYNIFEVPKEKRGNAFLAFSKVTDVEGYQRYICKGTEKTYPEILQNNYDIDINERYDQYWDVYHGLQQQAKEKREKKQTNKANFKDYFISNFINKDSNRPDGISKCRLTKARIAMIMYDYYVSNEWELPSPSQGEITIMDLYLRYTDVKDLQREICEYWRIF